MHALIPIIVYTTTTDAGTPERSDTGTRGRSRDDCDGHDDVEDFDIDSTSGETRNTNKRWP